MKKTSAPGLLDTPTTTTNGMAGMGPFYDPAVTQYHPAIMALEMHILGQPAGAKFQYRWMREFVGKEITGFPRECLTRSVGTLMSRLTKSGIVSLVGRDEWQKLAKLTK